MADHTLATWRHVGLWWGDHGRWLGEIQRFAQGEVLYRDFNWPFPPLALWLFGTVARFLGTSVGAVSAATVALFLLLVLAFHQYARRIVSRQVLPLTIAAGLLLSFAYAMRVGAPLPLGTYSPAAPLGVVLLLGATLAALRLIETPTPGRTLALGALCGLCVLTKQDFWVPAFYLLAAAPVLATHGSFRESRRLLAFGFGAAALVVLPAVALIISQTDWATVPAIAGGFGRAAETMGRAFPSWSRLTLGAIATSWLLAIGLACLAVARPAERVPGLAPSRSDRVLARWSAALAVLGLLLASFFILQTYRTGVALHADGLPQWPTSAERALWFHAQEATPSPRVSLGILRTSLQSHLLPLALPVLLLVTVLTTLRHRPAPDRRGILIALLLGLCIAARARRLFEGVDWHHFLIEIPVYVAALEWYGTTRSRDASRALRVVLSALIVVGAYSYWQFGVGPGTIRQDRLPVLTEAGLVRMGPPEARLYQELSTALDRLDPAGERPLYASGLTEAFAYFIGRENASRVTESFRFSRGSPARLIADIRKHRPPPILLDNRVLETVGAPPSRLDLRHWEIRRGPNWFARVDRPWFDRLNDCAPVLPTNPDPVWNSFALYDCR